MFGTIKPVSVFISSLLLLVASSPLPVNSQETPELRQLTPKTFPDAIKKNDWFVEFFSPYCGHCTAFKPTWTNLVASRDDPPRLSLAQVDCIAYGDLCREQGVEYYPYIRLYRNHANGTQTKELFSESRELSTLERWLDERVPKGTAPPPGGTYPIPALDSDSKNVQTVAKPKYNVEGKVLVLGADTFLERIASQPTFVKFYAPWCGHCQKLAPKWVDLAERLKGVINVAEVNCDAHGTVCREQEIEGYPTVVLYLNGKKIEYTGSKSVSAMEEYIRKAMSPRIETVDHTQYNSRLKEEDVLFLLLHSGKDNRVMDVISKAAQPLLGNPPIFGSTSKQLYSQYEIASTTSVPVLLAIKAHSPDHYAAKLELAGTIAANENADLLENWLQRNRFPLLGKLGMDNFYSVMKNPTKPFVVLAAIDPGPSAESESEEQATATNLDRLSANAKSQLRKFESIARAWADGRETKDKARETVFVWMDGRKWGKWLKNMYGIEDVSKVTNSDGTVGGGAGIVVVDHGSLLYYDADQTGRPIRLNSDSVFDALRAIYAGHGTPKHSENFLERIARNMNNRLLALEDYVKTHIKTTLFLAVVFCIFLIYSFKWCLAADIREANDYYVDAAEKRERGRLD
ncbi:hypothetical protein FRC19_008676 [Serendipita sp. 401]|nr:hypothetical protein FRC19_008676 [Serendipita sp. 401]